MNHITGTYYPVFCYSVKQRQENVLLLSPVIKQSSSGKKSFHVTIAACSPSFSTVDTQDVVSRYEKSGICLEGVGNTKKRM